MYLWTISVCPHEIRLLFWHTVLEINETFSLEALVNNVQYSHSCCTLYTEAILSTIPAVRDTQRPF